MTDSRFPVASEIRSQIGAQAFFMMGAYNLAANQNSLHFRIKGSPKVNSIIIKLMPDDTYTITFSKLTETHCTISNIVHSVYADMLHEIIEAETNLLLTF